ncbi:unnamed protein product [Ectocarpus sp. CCAP 1310/34]|nr:unnamed protein product [Ectocarpus sp. CCAP 1310/34]
MQDMNNDLYMDIAIGHALADPASGGGSSAGATYIIFGGGAISNPVNVLTDLNGSNGFVLEGASQGDRSGTSVSSAGDINQDGYDDIVIGAPGVGSDAGSAYVVFGGETFPEASYTLGAIDADGSYTLTAPSDEGFGGFSVSGAGDMNGDDFPDLVVGAYGSGTAGEAFVVFPGLTGTPPPTMSPTPGPPTPAPVSAGPGATPSPTVNFLVEGVVGAGTVHDSPGVFVRAHELGGQVRWFDDDTRVAMALEGLQEKSSEGDLVGLGAEVPHVVDGGGLVYEATATTNVTVEGVAAQQSTMTTSALGGEVSITVTMQVFEEDGVVTSGDEQTEVTAGTLKISLEVSDWPFCDPSTEPRRSTDDTPLTVCPAGTASSSTLETGAFLDVKIAVLGPSSSTPVLSTPALEDAARNGGVEYTMTGESAEATLAMSEWVSTDDSGWTKVGYDDMAYLCTHPHYLAHISSY